MDLVLIVVDTCTAFVGHCVVSILATCTFFGQDWLNYKQSSQPTQWLTPYWAVCMLCTFSASWASHSSVFAPVRRAMWLPAGGLLGVVQHTVQHTSASTHVHHGTYNYFLFLKCAGNVQYTLNRIFWGNRKCTWPHHVLLHKILRKCPGNWQNIPGHLLHHILSGYFTVFSCARRYSAAYLTTSS